MRFLVRISTTSTAVQDATASSSSSDGLIPTPSSGVERTTECLVESMPINCFPEIHFTVVVAMYLLCIYFVLGIAANGRRDYPPQVKPPPVLQLLLELAEVPAELAEKDTTDDIF